MCKLYVLSNLLNIESKCMLPYNICTRIMIVVTALIVEHNILHGAAYILNDVQLHIVQIKFECFPGIVVKIK